MQMLYMGMFWSTESRKCFFLQLPQTSHTRVVGGTGEWLIFGLCVLKKLFDLLWEDPDTLFCVYQFFHYADEWKLNMKLSGILCLSKCMYTFTDWFVRSASVQVLHLLSGRVTTRGRKAFQIFRPWSVKGEIGNACLQIVRDTVKQSGLGSTEN